MRYHQHDIVPEHIVAEAKAKRRHELRLLSNPLCSDPGHPGCKHCEPEMFPEPVPEGYMSIDEWADLHRKQLADFIEKYSNEPPRDDAGWTELHYDFLSTWGMK